MSLKDSYFFFSIIFYACNADIYRNDQTGPHKIPQPIMWQRASHLTQRNSQTPRCVPSGRRKLFAFLHVNYVRNPLQR